jgi:gag-polypeptide of LTR copia-type
MTKEERILKLKGSKDYPIWAMRMESSLIKEKLFSPIEDENHTRNKEALAYIQLSLADGPLMQTKHITTAKAAWDALKNLYNSSGFSSNFLTIKALFNTTITQFSSIEEYLNKVKELIEELNSRDINIPEIVMIAWILNNLDDSYNGYITTITQALRNNPDAYTLETLFSSLINKAKQFQALDSDDQVNITSKKP